MSDGTEETSMLFNSKSRSSAGGSWQRRRFTKSAATVDGQYDPDLALAIQESLKQAEMDALKSKENQSDTLSKLENNVGKENRTGKSSNSELSNETQHLKDLVHMNMDLIQQQQDELNQKDKTIKSLRAENNALQCRLQRMERRMALLKQKEEMSGSTHIVTSPPPKPGTMSYTEPIDIPFDKQSHKKKLDNQVWPTTTTPLPKKTTETPKQCQSQSKTPVSAIDINKSSHRKRKLASAEDENDASDSKTLETNNLYYVSYYEPVAEDVEVDLPSDVLRQSAQSQRQMEVEVPSFRIKTYANLYTIEGTEDHEDDTFLRRHQKPEMEEKRRKRWDDQRLREEIMLERLREKQENKHKHREPEDPVESFYPCLDDITHIEVLDKIPVTAFGLPIPFSKTESFSLPWTPKTRSSSRHRQK